MKSWGIRLAGFRSARRLFNDLRFEIEDDRVYLVGPTVEYAVHVELGTTKMPARPFVRPAVNRVQANVGEAMTAHLSVNLANANEDQILRSVALTLEREIKNVITEKGLIDTGAMRSSVTIEKV